MYYINNGKMFDPLAAGSSGISVADPVRGETATSAIASGSQHDKTQADMVNHE